MGAQRQDSPEAKYERDFHAWTIEQAALLRAGRSSELDVRNLAEWACPYSFEQILDETFWPALD